MWNEICDFEMMSNPDSSPASNNPWVLSATDKDSESKVNPTGDIHQFEDHFVLQTSVVVEWNFCRIETFLKAGRLGRVSGDFEPKVDKSQKSWKVVTQSTFRTSQRRSKTLLGSDFYLTFCCSLIFTVWYGFFFNFK